MIIVRLTIDWFLSIKLNSISATGLSLWLELLYYYGEYYKAYIPWYHQGSNAANYILDINKWPLGRLISLSNLSRRRLILQPLRLIVIVHRKDWVTDPIQSTDPSNSLSRIHGTEICCRIRHLYCILFTWTNK